MRQQSPSLGPSGSTTELGDFCTQICAELGPGFEARPVPEQPDLVHLWTPEGGCLTVQLRNREVLVQASDWPVVDMLGLRRSFSRSLSARVSIDRDVASAAQDLERRIVQPFRAALSEARRQATAYREVLNEVSECLELSGLKPGDCHTIGRTVQARRPLGSLETEWTRVPTQTATTVHLRDEGALGSLEVHYLTLRELAELNQRLDELIARRRPALRLSA